MKKFLSAISLACVLSFSAFAQILPGTDPVADAKAFAKVRARMDSIRQYRPTVGLVLAGGGARGLAHLGVIKYMEELGIPVDVITGTSMGGLVGGLYALGYRHEELDSLVRDIQWPVMMSDKIPDEYIGYRLRKYRERFVLRVPFHYDNEDLADRLKKEAIWDRMEEEAGQGSSDMLKGFANKMGVGMPDGFLYGLNVRNMLSSISVGYQDSLSFANLPIPFACVATDLYSMSPKYWTEGSITTALRSTMAIPFYFRAVRGGGEILLDGGMRNNFPVDIAKEMGADIVIGSDMSVHRGIDELNSPVDFLFQTITLLSSGALGPAMEMLDLNVHHELKGYNMLSFDDKSVDDIIDQGYQNALAHKELFESIAAAVAGRPVPDVVRHEPAVNLALTKVRVNQIKFTGISEDDQNKILHPRDFPADGMYDRATVERLLNNIYGTNAFEAVTYRMEGHQEPYSLVFECQKGQVNDFAAGIRADTDETVAVALHLGLGTRRLGGPRLTTDLKLGTNPSLTVEGAVKSKIGLPTVGLAFRSRLISTSSIDYLSNIEDKLLTTALDAYLEDSRLRFGSMRIGVTAEMDPYERYLGEGEFWKGWDWRSYWLSAFCTLKHDSFDDGYFPTRGIRLALDGRYVFKGYSIDLDPELYHEIEDSPTTEGGKVPRYGSVAFSFEGAFSLGENFTILPSVRLGWNSADYHLMNPKHAATVGGFLANRYTERQLPFFGKVSGYWHTPPAFGVGQVDLRFRFVRKNYFTARAGFFTGTYDWKNLILSPDYAFGLEYGRQTLVGPLKFALQWCNATGVTAYASIGFDF